MPKAMYNVTTPGITIHIVDDVDRVQAKAAFIEYLVSHGLCEIKLVSYDTRICDVEGPVSVVVIQESPEGRYYTRINEVYVTGVDHKVGSIINITAMGEIPERCPLPREGS